MVPGRRVGMVEPLHQQVDGATAHLLSRTSAAVSCGVTVSAQRLATTPVTEKSRGTWRPAWASPR